MKKNIHPEIYYISVSCSCSNIFKIYSSNNNDLNIDTCYKCHPFYTGKQKISSNIGRIGKFNRKYKNML